MTNDALPRLPPALEQRFYYLEYPNPVPSGFWKDGNGKYVPMELMGLDHLKASIQRILNDREAFLTAHNDGKYDFLLPLIDAKLNELREALIKGSTL